MINMTNNEYCGENYDIKFPNKLQDFDEKDLENFKICEKIEKNILSANVKLEDTFEDLQGVNEDLKILNCFGEDCDMENDEKLQDFDEKDLENFKICEKIQKKYFT